LSSGGTGISLDHRYAHARPRWVMSTITYWAAEFAQALGRCVRVSTITDTTQEIYIPQNTLLSDHMAPKLATKLKSIDAIGSSNVDLAAELERAVRKKEAARQLTAEELKGSESSGVIETAEDDDEEGEE
jgi:superfamily II DNA or RNA helicase